MRGIKCWQVDAFTNRPFKGNPAAVCWLDEAADSRWMQSVAAEMNLSETAFVRRRENAFELRWFTPTVEVDLCGHATLATAHVLWSSDLVPQGMPICFQTRSGVLTCTQDRDFIELDFPATPATAVEISSELSNFLGVEPVYLARSCFDYLAVFESAETVRSMKPDFRKLGTLPVRGVIATSLADNDEFDFVSRFFAPAVGVDEDPVCGSAHCCLAPYWAARLKRTRLMANQISARGGVLRLTLDGDRVMLAGQAVTVWLGELRV